MPLTKMGGFFAAERMGDMEILNEFKESDGMEFVAIQNGKEIDWVDPVLFVLDNTQTITAVNPYAKYVFTKPCEYIIRKRVANTRADPKAADVPPESV